MRPHRGPAQFWNTDRGLTALLASLVAMIFVAPSLQYYPAIGTLFVQIVLTLILVSGLVTVILHRAGRVIAVVVFAAAIALHWVDYLNPGLGLGVWTAVGRLVSVSFLTGLVVRQVFREGPITMQRIQGAVAVYLLLGLTWAALYELIHGIWPAAFRFADAPQSRLELAATLAYYSFVTLTTMGYGDVTPVHPAARSAAILEALTGQLFPAILIGRLVAMELAASDRRDR